MERMILAFHLPPGSRQRLDRFLADLQDPSSPRYRQWLQPEAFAAGFGPAPADIARVSRWLEAEGFKVEGAARGGMSLVFSGTAATVQRAFGTPIQRFAAGGRPSHANTADPSIPAGFAGAVAGIVSLHDLPRRGAMAGVRRPQYTSGTDHSLAPGDFATIYNLAPLHAAGLDGSGTVIAVAGRSNPGLADVAAFRSRFGLPPGHASVVLAGGDPGQVSPDEALEADLDLQWAGAAAPGASVLLVCAASTGATDGVDLAAAYAVDNNLAPVLSVSFGSCEAAMGQAELEFYANLWSQAAAQGITVCVASGDSGAAGCGLPSDAAGTGAGVSGMASTPYDLCVGGTMFQDAGGTFWSGRNGAGGGSALGYIPEAAWNESGAREWGSGLWAGGGGASRIYPKPAWQTAPGVPRDGKRDVPDVALAAASAEGYLACQGGTSWVVGGTSASTPAFAGIMALKVQKAGLRQGALHPGLYAMATLQAASAGPAVFHDVLTGDNTVPGVQGFQAGPGYDLCTGLGSLDAARFVNAGEGPTLDPSQIAGTFNLGSAFSRTFTAAGASGPCTFSLLAGALPPGLALAPDGALAGTLSAEGSYAFSIQGKDAQGGWGVASGAVQVGPVSVTATPGAAGLMTGTQATYRAQVGGAVDAGVLWSASGGLLVPAGPDSVTFSASAPGIYLLTATSAASPQRAATITVDVHDAHVPGASPGPVTGLDALYVAGCLGSALPQADLSGDGLVDDTDLAMVLAKLGW
jgi:subtilase family serine protease